MSFDPVTAFASIAGVEHVTSSPDGTHTAFTWTCTGRPELYVVDTDGGEPRQLTTGTLPQDVTHVPVIWHPDGDRLYIRAGNQTSETNLAVVSLDGTIESIVTREEECLPWDISSDGNRLLYRVRGEDGSLRVRRRVLATDRDTRVYEFEHPVHMCAGGYDPVGECVILHEGQDGAMPLFFSNDTFEDATPLEIDGHDGHIFVKAWHSDGNRLLVHDGEGYLSGRAGVHNLHTGETEWLTLEDVDERPLTFRDNGGIVANNWRSLVLYDGDQNRTEHQVDGNVLIPPSVTDGVKTTDGVVFARRTQHRPFELVQYTPETDDVELLVKAEFGPLNPHDFVEGERVEYETTNGDSVDAILYRPDNETTPVVAELYGARMDVAPRFDPLVQLLVHSGFAVFRPGNTGGAYDERAHEDYAAAARWLKEQEWTDGVAAYGHSHGGYNVAYQLGRYDCWNAGIAYNGVLDIEAIAENGDLLPAAVRALGDPDENADAYAHHNPSRYADGVSDPVLILHGTADPICPLYQAEYYRDALEATGLKADTDFEYRLFEGQEHGSRNTEEKAVVWRTLLDFLHQRL